MEKNTFVGFDKEAEEPFRYYIMNCNMLKDKTIENFQATYGQGMIKVEGIGKNMGLNTFFCHCFFDEMKRELLVISTINNSENEPIFTTDTFHFLEDEVLVNSNSSDLGEIEYEIPLYSSLIRK